MKTKYHKEQESSTSTMRDNVLPHFQLSYYISNRWEETVMQSIFDKL